MDFLCRSVQFSRSVMSDSLLPHESQHARPPVHHQLPEFTQTHVHVVGDAIQPSHPLSSPSPPAPNPSQHQGQIKWYKYHSRDQNFKSLELLSQRSLCPIFCPGYLLLSDKKALLDSSSLCLKGNAHHPGAVLCNFRVLTDYIKEELLVIQ